MANKTINDYSAATGIDASVDYLLIEQSGVYNKINRNTLMGVSGTPADISTSQTLTNKVVGNTNSVTQKDGTFTLQNTADTTKQAKFSLSGITTGTTRTFTLPDASDTIVTLGATQTLTNKTLTSPTVNSPTITNATISADSLTGYTVSNNGTVYGMSVTGGVLNSAALAGSVNAAAIAQGAVQPQALQSGTGTTWVTQPWVPTITGFSANPTGGVYQYCQIGKLVILFITQPNVGTSNATTFSISLPVNARTLTNAQWSGYGQVMDNNSIPTNPGILLINSGATTLTVYPSWAGGVWTASGNKRLVFGTVVYEVA